jgi:hypothetical protein
MFVFLGGPEIINNKRGSDTFHACSESAPHAFAVFRLAYLHRDSLDAAFYPSIKGVITR